MSRTNLCASSLFLASACTLSDGRGFARIDRAEIAVEIEQSSADPAATWTTESGYVVRLDEATVRIRGLSLSGHAADEESPSAHVHDGEETPADGEGEELETVVSMPIDADVNALSKDVLVATRFLPSRELPRVRLETATVGVRRLELTGTVSGGPAGAGLSSPLPLHVAVETDVEVEEHVDLEITEDGPSEISVFAKLEISPSLLDAVDFASFSQSGRVHIDGTSEAGRIIAENAVGSHVEVHF